jgi:DNA-binding MarR family transcriptional regulator
MSAFDPKSRSTSLSGMATTALYRISQAIGHMLRARGSERQLSPAQIQALLFLRYARPGVRTIGGLVERLSSTYATTSGVVDALEKKQLVTRKPLEHDHRTVTLHLTEDGVEEAAALDDMLHEIDAAIAELPPDEQQVLMRATQAIVRRLQDSGHVRVYEMCWNCQFFQRNAHPDHPHGAHHCGFVDAPLHEPNTYLECPDFVEQQP